MIKKFPSIESFKVLIREVTQDIRYAGKDEAGNVIFNNNPLPNLTFIGTTKIHGTNGSIVYEKKTDEILAQSRNRKLTIDHDNNGFCAYVLKYEYYWKMLCREIINDYDRIVIFGEWIGPGIQSGVAVSKLPKKIFVVFSIFFQNKETEFWVDTLDLAKYLPNCLDSFDAYNITEFGTWFVDIDFNSPELIQNTLIDITNTIEVECPVGKYFGISGVGEGIVFSHNLVNKIYRFKVKGEKHSNSKVKCLAPINEEEYKNVRDFAENYVTESRLLQGIQWMTEMNIAVDIKHLGAYIKWVTGDVFKEEINNIAENDLDAKKVAKEISNIAREFFMKNYT